MRSLAVPETWLKTTLINSCSRGPKKFTEPRVHRSSLKWRAPTKSAKPGPWTATSCGPLRMARPGPRAKTFNLRMEEQLRQEKSEQSHAFLSKACSLKKMCYSRADSFSSGSVCSLWLFTHNQRASPFPMPHLFPYLKKKKKWLIPSPIAFSSKAWKLEDI